MTFASRADFLHNSETRVDWFSWLETRGFDITFALLSRNEKPAKNWLSFFRPLPMLVFVVGWDLKKNMLFNWVARRKHSFSTSACNLPSRHRLGSSNYTKKPDGTMCRLGLDSGRQYMESHVDCSPCDSCSCMQLINVNTSEIFVMLYLRLNRE